MANQKHLDILKQGVVAWNAWRMANPDVRLDLREADLSGVDLGEAHFGEEYLSGVDLREAHFGEEYLSGVDLREANLRGANLSGADLGVARLSRANLSGTDLRGVNLVEASLSKAILREANLSGADLGVANLSGADLSDAILSGANLSDAILSGANLKGAELFVTNLSRANLSLANLSEAVFGAVIFADTDLSIVNGLETVLHDGPSTIGIDTIIRSHGKIPETFLRGCGVPDGFIEYLPALIGAMQPIQYYSCFISHSTKDNAFAKRLHERMRAEHLRVWYAPEDIQGGKKIIDQLDRAIQLHDRLLLVLSEHSMQSAWVLTEVLRAQAAEQREQRQKLFPIRLVDFDTIKSWRYVDPDSGKDIGREIREYHIPDFSNWKDHDAFEAAFARLLRDLRAAETTER